MGRLQKRLRMYGPRRRMELVAAGTAALVVGLAVLFVAPSAISAQATSPPPTHHGGGKPRGGGKHPGPPPKPPQRTKHLLPPGRMLAIGDSVMDGCKSALRPALDYRVHVDAKVGAQIDDTITDLNHYRRKHRLPKTVIIQVGNNGPLYYGKLILLKEALRGVPDIVVVNVRNGTSWETESNKAITQWLSGWHAAHLADWYGHSTNNMLYPDGTHPYPYACRTYARVIATTLRESNS
jgi:hypothetical protein